MGIVQSTIFKIGCKYFNWRNRNNESGSSDTQSLQNSEAGGSTLRIRQLPLPFKPTRFREQYKPKRSNIASTDFYLIPGEKDEDRRRRLYGAPIASSTCTSTAMHMSMDSVYQIRGKYEKKIRKDSIGSHN